jgi:hypothetical protein
MMATIIRAPCSRCSQEQVADPMIKVPRHPRECVHFITTLSFSSHLWYLESMHTLTGPYAAVGPASPPHGQEGA